MQFAHRAADIIGTSSAIIYTDFISDVGPIISALAELGIDAVGYHGELDGPSRHQSYMRWKSDDVKVIVATKAFGMGINKPDIRHIVRNGVPENVLSWEEQKGMVNNPGPPFFSARVMYHILMLGFLKTYQTRKDVTESYQDFTIMAVCLCTFRWNVSTLTNSQLIWRERH